VVAALNTATHVTGRTVAEYVRDVLPELTVAAGAIEADLRVAGRFTRVSAS
jgi:IclR family pca regulon transcriptional regulator